MHIFSFDRWCEILLCHSSISAETSTSATLTWCTNTLKLIRMLKYWNNTCNNSYWQQQTLENKTLEKINQRKKRRNSTVRRKRIMTVSSISFLLRKTNTFISSGISSGKGSATIIFFEKNFPNLNLQGSFLYFLHVAECLWSWYNLTKP